MQAPQGWIGRASWFCLCVLVSVFLGDRLVKPARACTILAPPPKLIGVPSDGATDVPTDVILYYDIPIAVRGAGNAAPDSIVLKSNGQTTTVSTRTAWLWGFEVLPASRLLPNTQYTLEASWVVGNQTMTDSLSFTTAAGPLSVKPPTPVATLYNYRLLMHQQTSCAPASTGTCVSLADDNAYIEATYEDSFGQDNQYVYLYKGSFLDNLSGIDQGTNFVCVKLRTRGMNGALSDALRLCGADYPLSDLPGTTNVMCSSHGLSAPAATPDAGTTDAASNGTDAATPTMPEPPVSSDASTLEPDAASTPKTNVSAPSERANPTPRSHSCAVQTVAPEGARSSWLVGFVALWSIAFIRLRARSKPRCMRT